MDEKPRGDTPAGTQSLGRSIRLMRVLATRGEIGWRLSDLAAACGLDKGTAHRILASLVQERLVRQRPGDRRYLPGPLLFELSLALPLTPAGERELARVRASVMGGGPLPTTDSGRRRRRVRRRTRHETSHPLR